MKPDLKNLKKGDFILTRVEVEDPVIDSDGEIECYMGTRTVFVKAEHVVSIEKRKLAVGDKIKADTNSSILGEILFISDGTAFVRWHNSFNDYYWSSAYPLAGLKRED